MAGDLAGPGISTYEEVARALPRDYQPRQSPRDRARALFEEAGSRPGRMRVDLHEGHALAAIGNRRLAEQRLHEAIELARDLTNPRAEAKGFLFLGEQRFWYDEPAAARPHLEAAVELAAQQDGVAFSAWLNEAARRELLRRDGLAGIAEWESEAGALTPEEIAAGEALLDRLLEARQ